MKLRFVLRSGGGLLLEDSIIDADLLAAHVTLMSYIYNRDIGGGVRWWNPRTGRPITTPRYTVEEVEP